MKCQKYRQLNEYVCTRCGYCYSVKDPEPPECLTVDQYSAKRLKEIKEELEK